MSKQTPKNTSDSSSSSSSSSSNSSSSSRTPSPKSRLIKVSNLTGNINRNHLYEIFENYGDIKSVKLSEKKVPEGKLKRGHAYVKMVHKEDAALAKKCMNGGWIDGNIVGVSMVDLRKQKRRYRRRSRSPKKHSRRSASEDGSSSYRRS